MFRINEMMKLVILIGRFLFSRFPSIADAYRYLRDSKPLKRPLELRPALGFKFNGPESMEQGVFEPQETIIFEKAVNCFDLVVNVGANTGYYALKALSRGVDVCAFEPNYLNTKILLRNVMSNDFESDFHLIPIALSDAPGILPLYGVSTGASLVNGWAGQTHVNLVPVNTFDNIASNIIVDKSCFVIMDIEGAELNCLKGSKSLLSGVKKNVFFIEISVGEHQPEGIAINPNLRETFSLFFSFGYKCHTADQYLRSVKIEEVDQILLSGTDSLGTHNFLFLAEERDLSEIGLG
jgi:FkbM family methyltransferase